MLQNFKNKKNNTRIIKSKRKRKKRKGGLGREILKASEKLKWKYWIGKYLKLT